MWLETQQTHDVHSDGHRNKSTNNIELQDGKRTQTQQLVQSGTTSTQTENDTNHHTNTRSIACQTMESDLTNMWHNVQTTQTNQNTQQNQETQSSATSTQPTTRTPNTATSNVPDKQETGRLCPKHRINTNKNQNSKQQIDEMTEQLQSAHAKLLDAERRLEQEAKAMHDKINHHVALIIQTVTAKQTELHQFVDRSAGAKQTKVTESRTKAKLLCVCFFWQNKKKGPKRKSCHTKSLGFIFDEGKSRFELNLTNLRHSATQANTCVTKKKKLCLSWSGFLKKNKQST